MVSIRQLAVLALGVVAQNVHATEHLVKGVPDDFVRGCQAACSNKWGLKEDKQWNAQYPDYPGLNGFPFHFTSTFAVHALPDNVVNAKSEKSFGQEGGQGWFNYGIAADQDVICFNITIVGVQPPFKSPALTSTHIHQGEVGKAGPPRIAFPDPVAVEGHPGVLQSIGCKAGPFQTGIKVEGKDTGEGFKVKQIEENPSGFFTDVHTEARPDGAVRGQLA
ncbi:hypothetical protein FRC03_004325 [Tulasnella sp. 419]|nr:hypothetical protein FRC02_008954 [Tulasnella sp. 418]KAG8962348.1 hypothetical protein FRC03_004325 [Tulasnella sp. 419]